MQDVILSDNSHAPLTILETDNLQTCVRMVESSFFFTLLPRVKPESDSIQANKYSLKGDYRQTLYICYRKNTYHSRIMDGVINTTVKLLGDVYADVPSDNL
jgi:hypothetical protein